jgi:hypothetical protein
VELVKPSLLPEPVPTELVEFSVLPEPAELHVSRRWPEPEPAELVEFTVLPEPAPEAVVRLSVLPPPVPTKAGLVVWPPPALAPEPAAAVERSHELSVLPGPTPMDVVEVSVEPEPVPVAAPEVVGLRPPVAPVPQQARRYPPTPARQTKPERAAPSGPRRLLVGFSAVVLGALSVVAIRVLVRGDDDDVNETAVPTPSAVVQTSIPAPDDAGSPATVESGASATTVAAPTVSATVSATAAPESPTTVPTNTPTVPAVPVTTNSTPAPGATQFSGVGNDVIDLRANELSRTIMVVTHNGVANFELTTLDQDLNQIALVESVVGTVSGTYPLGLYEQVTASYLRVDADGVWAIEIKPIESARLWQADSIAGTGPDVLRFEGGASVLEYTNAGSSNFIVQYLRNPGFDLLVNEIGPISGATTMQGGPGVVIVDAEGDWALSASPA